MSIRLTPGGRCELAARLRGFDLCIEATGLAPFTELLGRIAQTEAVPVISVALYRGGAVARIRRQGDGDTPFLERRSNWRFPPIPAGDPSRDYVGVEVGCAAPIHNAPPACVTHAASLMIFSAASTTSRIAESFPTRSSRSSSLANHPSTSEEGSRSAPPDLLLSDRARRTMIAAARAAHPNETGGVLAGINDDAGTPVIALGRSNSYLPCLHPRDTSWPRTQRARRSRARQSDSRIGYLGEWHSHPTDQPASKKDRVTMQLLAERTTTGTPALLVLRPKPEDDYNIDGYLALRVGELRQVDVIGVGPLEASYEEPT